MKKWAAVTTILAATFLAPAAPASAYDEQTCSSRYGTQSVESVRRFRIDTSPYSSPPGRADFGDSPYPYGSPQGTAVVCWLVHGGVAVVGRLSVESSQPLHVQARVTLFLADGSTSSDRTYELVGTTGDSMEVASARLAGGQQMKVRIRLFAGGQQVASQSFAR